MANLTNSQLTKKIKRGKDRKKETKNRENKISASDISGAVGVKLTVTPKHRATHKNDYLKICSTANPEFSVKCSVV